MSLINRFRARFASAAMVFSVAFGTLSLSLITATPAAAQAKLNRVITSLFGKTRAQVEARAGKGKPAEYGSVAYKYPGAKSINVYYAPANYGSPELDSKVLSVSIKFLEPLQDWKEALRRAGFPAEGVILGDDAIKSKGFFKNIKGVPTGFIGYTDKETLHLTHWSYLSLSMAEFTRPKGE